MSRPKALKPRFARPRQPRKQRYLIRYRLPVERCLQGFVPLPEVDGFGQWRDIRLVPLRDFITMISEGRAQDDR